MNCEQARSALSSLLDGEAPAVASDDVERHLSECAACRAWREDAHDITRRVRLGAAPPPPAVPESLLRGLVVVRPGAPWRDDGLVARLALAVIALVQLAVTVPALLLGADHDAPVHVAHEMGSFDMALAAGFLVAAWRPTRAQGMRALVGVAALLLVVTAVIDLIAGRTSLTDEAPHLLVVAGWLLLCRLAATSPSTGDERLVPIGLLRRARTTLLARTVAPPGGGEHGGDARRIRRVLGGDRPGQPELPYAPGDDAAERRQRTG